MKPNLHPKAQENREKIPPRFFKGKRIEITRVLIEELQNWKSTKEVSVNELLKLVDKLNKIHD